jgi:hypothetical protein
MQFPPFLTENEPDPLLSAAATDRDRLIVLLGMGLGLRVP